MFPAELRNSGDLLAVRWVSLVHPVVGYMVVVDVHHAILSMMMRAQIPFVVPSYRTTAASRTQHVHTLERHTPFLR